MSWTNTNPMEEKIKFIRAWQSGQYTVSDLCNAHNISRTTGHRLIRKFNQEGEKCFFEKSKGPKNIPNKTNPKIEKAIIKLRKKHKLWGARKLMKLLEKKFNLNQIPSETTVNAILKRNGFVKARKRRPHKIEKLNPKFDPSNCNEIWSADYKGKFRLGNKRYCHPLTICDSKSRFLFTSKGHYNPTYKAVKEEFTRVFKKYGLPLFMHTDNGTPFGSIQAIQRFSKLSYWLIDLGIHPIFSDPGCPQQNGRHERMHKDLKAFCANPPLSTLRKQQTLMDNFVKEYNEIRPHESLDMFTPKQIHQTSNRKFPKKIPDYDYPYDFKKLKVSKNGTLRWGAYQWVYISRGAVQKIIGIQEIGNGIWKVFYRNVFLGYFDEKLINRKEQYLKLSKIIV